MEPIVNDKLLVHDGLRTHFPRMNQTSSSSNILCHNCTENQQKIIQLLHSFEIPLMSTGYRKKYDDYAVKLEKRYPLCATCSFRVQVQLKKCEDEASLSERRQTAQSGEDWQNKLKLAQKMKWKHTRRKFIKGVFFWPDFLFQLLLTFKCVMKAQIAEGGSELGKYAFKFVFIEEKDLKIWAPNTVNFPSFFFGFLLILFSIQIYGIAFGKFSSISPLYKISPQIFLLISRCFIGNFLYRCDRSVLDLSSVLTLSAVGLAIIFKTGSKNAFVSDGIGFVRRGLNNEIDTIIFSKNQPPQTQPKDVLNSKLSFSKATTRANALNDKKGFAAYSDNHHAFYSFANQVAENVTKPIMPWPDKPLPSKNFNNQSDPFRKFNENMSSFNNVGYNGNVGMKPTKLDVYDPLELEPMFSSFSLSDEPVEKLKTPNSNPRRRVIAPTNNANATIKPVSTSNPFIASNTGKFKLISFKIDHDMLKIGYNSVLTAVLSLCRISLLNSSSSLVTIILALTFGLRGFIWPRLSLKIQLLTLFVAVGRLAWLTAEINGKIPVFMSRGLMGYLALSLDLILIILR